MEESAFLLQLPVSTWPIGIYLTLLVVLLLMAYVFGRYKDQTSKMLMAAINPRSKSTLERSDSESIVRVGIFLNIIFLLNFLILIWLTIEEVKQENIGFKQTGYLLEVILLFFGLKFVFQK